MNCVKVIRKKTKDKHFVKIWMIKQNRNCIKLSEKKTKICENLVNEAKQEVCKAAKKRMTTIQGDIDGEPKEK